MAAAAAGHGDIDRVVHLAAQAGVRYSLRTRLPMPRRTWLGIWCLELCRGFGALRHLVYASSSSVYGATQAAVFGGGSGRPADVALRGNQARR